jgi:uncharacterized OB-fold protein
LPINERITSADELRSWTDRIPLRYEYTAGVAGERFLQGLKRGEILAGECGKCGKKYLPPKMYCVDCFVQIEKFSLVRSRGVVAALTETWVDFQGKRRNSPVLMAFVVFKGVTGGIIHSVEGKGLRIGSIVEPIFAPESLRKGSLSDIEKFVAARPSRK